MAVNGTNVALPSLMESHMPILLLLVLLLLYFWSVCIMYTAEPIYSFMIGKDAPYNQVSISKNDYL